MSLQVAPFQNVGVLRAFSLLPAKGETTTFHCFLQHFAVFFLASRFYLVMKIKVPRVPNVNVLAPSVPIASVWAPTHTHTNTRTRIGVYVCVYYTGVCCGGVKSWSSCLSCVFARHFSIPLFIYYKLLCILDQFCFCVILLSSFYFLYFCV